MDEIKIKTVIRKKYAQSANTGGCGCSPSVQNEGFGCCGQDFANAASSADEVIGAADLGLSCGLPVQDAGIKPGTGSWIWQWSWRRCFPCRKTCR